MAESEIRGTGLFGDHVMEISVGKLIIRDLVVDQIRVLLQMRSLEKVYALVCSITFNNEEELFDNTRRAIKELTNAQWECFVDTWKDIYAFDVPTIFFRVSVKLKGRNKVTDKTLFSQFIASSLDSQFQKDSALNTFHMESNLEQWNMEYMANLRKGKLWLGISLTEEAIWKKRSYQSLDISFGKTSLKPSICYAMLTLLDTKSGIILEPMVGSGMIVLELIDLHILHGLCICGDNAYVAIQKTKQNLQAVSATYDVFHWNATALPLLDNSVDGIVTDLPFGKRIANESKIGWDYPLLLDEFFRVLKKKSRAVLLTSHITLMNKLVNKDRRWIRQNQVRINHGGIECAIFVLAKRYIPKHK